MEKVENVQINQKTSGPVQAECAMTGEEVLTCAINIGEQLLMSGAEISPVWRTRSGGSVTHMGFCRAISFQSRPVLS